MPNKHYISVIVLALFVLCPIANGDSEAEEEAMDISPRCAAVLLSGALGGAGLAYTMTPAVLCTVGFCPAGVAGSSFAAWWQSTLPQVSAGSMFATLQSIAMGGMGTKVVLTGSVLGGSAVYLEDLCKYVDDPNSNLSPVFDVALEAIQVANQATEKAKEACSSLDSCSTAVGLFQSASSSVSSMWSHFSNSVSQHVETISISAESLLLEREIASMKKDIEDLKGNSFSGQIIETMKDYPWTHGILNWLSEGTIGSILELEKNIMEKEARLHDLKRSNE